MSCYERIVEKLNEIAVLDRAKSCLYWDQVMDLPEKGGKYRGQQLATLTKLIKEKYNDPKLWDTICEAAEYPHDMTEIEQEDVFALKASLTKKRAVPVDLAVALAKAESIGERTWEAAKKTGDLDAFYSILRPLLKLRKEELAHTHPEADSYDASIETHNPGLTSAQIEPIFEELKTGLNKILNSLDLEKNRATESYRNEKFSISRQKLLCNQLIEELGFSADLRVVRESSHPFSVTLGPQDFRVTTRYDQTKMFDSFLSLAHEMGHSLYDEGLHSEDFHGMPRCNSHNLAVHESHSLFWENRVVCSLPSIEKYYHQFKSTFPESLGNASLKDFQLLTRGVQPSYIRVEADELTYCLHVIVRYEVEKALFKDTIKVEEINDFWNTTFKKTLGVAPLIPQDGCIQDIHWSGGAFGYFPSYALGHLISAQVTETFEKKTGVQLENSPVQISKIKSWLQENCYNLPAYLDVNEYLHEVTQKPLSAKPFLKYVDNKYSNIYR